MENQRKPSVNPRMVMTDFFARVSYEFEQIEISGYFILFFLFFLELLGPILPLLSFLKPQPPLPPNVLTNIHWFHTSIFKNDSDVHFYIQILHTILLIIIISTLLIRNNFFNRIGLQISTLYYFLSMHILIISSSKMASEEEFDMRNILTIANLLTGLLICIVYSIIRWSYSCKGVNYLLIFPNKWKTKVDLSYRTLSVVVPFVLIEQNNNFNIGLTSAYLVLFLVQTYIILGSFIHFKKLATMLINLTYTLKFSFFILIFLHLNLRQTLLEQNFFFVAASTFIFSSITLNRYLDYKNQQIQLSSIHEIETPSHALLYVYTIIKTFLKEDQNSYSKSQLITSTFRYEHMLECSEQDCYCTKVTSDQLQRKVIVIKLDEIGSKFSKNYQIVAFISAIKFQCFQVYASFLYKLKKLHDMQKNQYLLCFLLGKCSKLLEDFLQAKRVAQNTVPTQKIMESDYLVGELKQYMLQISVMKGQFWQKVYRGVSSLTQFDGNIEEQLSLGRNINRIAEGIFEEFKENRKCLDLLISYYSFIELRLKIPKKLKQLLRQIAHNSDKILFVIDKKVNSNINIVNQMYTNHVCIFESKIEEANMGVILNCSKTIKDVFGYDKNNVQNIQINKLMPKSMHKQHDKILENWLKTGSWSNISKLRYIYAINSQDVCFQTAIYLTIIQTPSSLNLLATFFKLNDRDFMLVNSDGIIDGAGNHFIELLGKKIIGLPLHLICEQADKILSWSDCKLKSKFYSIINKEDKIERYLYGQGKAENKSSCFFQEEQYFQIEFSIIRYSLGDVKFKVIKLLKLEEKENQLLFLDHVQEDQPKIQIDTQKQKKVENQIMVNCGSSSLASSMTNIDLAIEQTFENIRDYFYHPENIKQTKTFQYFFIIFLLVISGLILIGIQLNLISQYQKKEKEMLQVTLQIKLFIHMFETVYSHSFNSLIDPISHMHHSMKLERQWKSLREYYSEFEADNSLFLISENINQQSGMKWQIDGDHQTTLTLKQFISFLIFNIKQLSSMNQIPKQTYIKTAEHNFPLLRDSMIRDIQNIFVHITSQRQERFLLSVTIKSICLLIEFTVLIIFYSLNKQRKKQKDRLLCQFGFIDKSNCLMLKEYFWGIRSFFMNSSDNSSNVQFRSKVLDLEAQSEKLVFVQKRESQNRFSNDSKVSFKSFIILLCILLGGFGVNGISLYLDQNYKQINNQINGKLESMVGAETYLFSSLNRLKIHLIKGYSNHTQLANQLLEEEASYKNLMNDIFIQMNGLFATISRNETKIMDLLSENLCQYSQSAEDKKQCAESDLYEILEKGYLVILNQIQSKTLDAIYKLKKNQLAVDEFKMGRQLDKVDHLLSYLPRFFHLIQQLILVQKQIFLSEYESILKVIPEIRDLTLYSLFVLGMLVIYRSDRVKVSENMGRAVLIPLSVVKATKYMIKEITQILEI